MKAVVKYGLEDKNVELRDMPEPTIGADDVLLEVESAGVCGSDIEFWRNKLTYPINVPVIQGHEFCGVIRDTGSNVRGFKVGDRVVSETAAYICGVCEFCRSGEYNVCPERLGFGYGVHGAFTRYVKVPQRCLHHIPEGVPFEYAALTEPISVAYNAVAVKSEVKPGELVVVIGPGPIGLFAAQIAKIHGARVVVAGLTADAKRLQAAEKIGFEAVIDVQKHDLVKEVNCRSNGVGAPLVIDAAGANAAFAQAMQVVRRNGQITKIAWNAKPLDMSLDPLVAKAATLQGTSSHTWRTWENVLLLLAAQQLNMEAMVTHVLPITEWEHAFEAAEHRQAVKAVLQPV
ncbi:MAG: zinc-binding dehydrogenase [Candidatus Poribacteria bacterium]|nr:zinc-binding dehydrogenase [Candidatus Poribacteria bacterium]